MSLKRLKIAMLSIHSCPLGQLGGRDTGGMNVYVRELARALGEQGHRVDIYTRAHDVRDDQIYYPSHNVRLIHIRAGGVKGMHKLGQYSHLPDFAQNLEAFREKGRLEYDLVHSHYWLSGQVGRWLSELWHVPDIIMFHTLGAVKNRLGIGKHETRLRLETERGLAGSCRRIIAATLKEKCDLMAHYQASPEAIGIIPCGVNLKLFKPTPKEAARRVLGMNGDKVILFVGRIEPLKGIDRLLMAMSYLKKWPRLRLVIIGGDGSSRLELAKLKALVQELNIESSVSFLGSVPQERLPLFYSAADACVIPSHYESFCLVILESLACGTPVVATSVGAASSLIRRGESGYLVADNTPPNLAQKIERLLCAKNGSGHAASIRKSVAGFDWPVIAQAVAREYAAVLNGQHIPAS
ncbi:MAG: glycosyltransferase [Dehalococcoidales bacterium]